MKKHFSTCTLCEAMCGIEVTTEDEKILSIVGDKHNPFSQGHVCPKAVALKELYEDTDRIRQPLKKVEGKWQVISWDEAIDFTIEKLHGLQQQYGNDSVGIYLGNPNAHNFGAILFGPYFYKALKSHNRFSATSVDQLPHHIVSRKLFGHQNQIPIPDIDNTDYFMIIGGNPLASNGSIMTVPFVKKRLKAIQQKGGKVVVIDPKKSETAQISSEHHFIQPGTDALLMLAMINTLFTRKLTKTADLLAYAPHLHDVEQYVRPYSAERVADITGIRSDDIYIMVEEFAQAESAVCYGRMGASVQHFGTLTQYLIMLFNMLTGNLDKPGGMMFTQPAADYLPHSGRGSIGRNHSRVRKLPAFAGEFPVSALAEEILTPGNGQIKAMVLGAGNPILTTPNGQQLDRAFAQLKFMVAVDFYITESSRHADIILPPVTALERDHYDIVFHKFAVRNSAKYSPAIFPLSDDKRTDWQIYLDMAERLEAKRGKSSGMYQVLRDKTPTGVVDDLLKSGRYGKGQHQLDIQQLLDKPHGIDLGPLQAELPDALFHEEKLIDLSFDFFMPDLARLEQHFFSPKSAARSLLLIGRRHLKSNNSWLHNSRKLVKDTRRCTAQLHPDDARSHNVEHGQTVTISSRVGTIQIEVEVTDTIMPGVISVPHGWGHDKDGIQWQHAQQNAGVSANDLTDEMVLDELSGNAVLNGVPVTLHA
ncbi:molybdopterin oxidoreductase family protein [Aliiglaciecola sp. LCG003]|uniref:molybdopterin oxidoreductase family protein n=1 Tax=Aliiglaciecola sp. LCG003 TaxID=3053655 RepID=UPI0025745754|nr:molybdopterin oxidoreductase family protein [Aliiglaciecola sp. LCG003]WJG10917.1 molybdopterin oxidoreductase family protein [Aliiglaciecola sp. LCG003]